MTDSPPLPLHGSRVLLRRLATTDLSAFQFYRQDEEVARYQGWEPWADAKALTFLATMNTVDLLQPDTWCQIGIADRESGALIGDIGVCVRPEEDEAEMGFSVNAQWQRRGLATEAVGLAAGLLFEHTSIGHIVCITDARNFAAHRLLRRLRMDHVRTEKATFRREPCHEHVYLLSRQAHLSYQKNIHFS